MSARTRRLTGTDEAEWARFARQIAPLAGKGIVLVDVPSEPPNEAVNEPSPSRGRPVNEVLSHPFRSPPLGVGGQPPGIDTASWQRFRRGQLASARKLDLHGMTAQQAFHALRAFLRTAHSDRLRCVEIVTGRGDGEHGGVLRREFALWLNLPEIRPLVLAAVHPHRSSAMHAHVSNPGSVRLLLRRPRS